LPDELGRVGLLVFELAPIGAGIPLADLPDRLAQLRIVLAEREHDRFVGLVAIRHVPGPRKVPGQNTTRDRSRQGYVGFALPSTSSAMSSSWSARRRSASAICGDRCASSRN